jgi:glycosyltransferase involved in cell wall biosynthesis
MQNKSILFFADQDPKNPTSGGMIRDRIWLELLPDSLTTKTIWANLYSTGKKSFIQKIMNALRSYPENGFNPLIEAELQKSFSPGSILIISRLANGKYIETAKKIGYQVILDEHNVESYLIKSMLPSLIKAPYQWYLYFRILRIERKYVQNADQVFCTSEADQKLLSKWVSSSKIKVIPNLIKTEEYNPNKKPEERKHILFAGTLDYYPNITGLEWFLNVVLPIIKKQNPELMSRFLIAGRNPTQSLKHLIQKNQIQLIENPINLKPIIADSTLLFVPLLFGGGTRIKILEGLASGTPIVSTSKGTEGFNFENKGVLIADSPVAFAQKLIELATNPENQSNLNQLCQKTVSEYCDIQFYRTKIKSILDSMN